MNVSRFESLTGVIDLEFPEYEHPPSEPICLLTRWLSAAEHRVREPRAMALATANIHAHVSNRIVAIINIDAQGLIFSSHTNSRKGRDLAATGWASGVLYWRETGQQVIVSGAVHILTNDESDALWFARPTPMHAMSTVSRQSEPLLNLSAVRSEAARLASLKTALPRPERFVGYRLEPHEMEFWCASSDRLHRRLRYDRVGEHWSTMRLQP